MKQVIQKLFSILTAGVMLCSSQAVTALDASIQADSETMLTETEPNDDFKSRNEIKLNQSIQGDLSTPQDVDIYEFEVTERGYINIDFSHDYIDNPGIYWKIDLTSNRWGSAMRTTYEFRGNAADTEIVKERTRNLGLEPEKYTIKVYRGAAYNQGKENYTFKVNFIKDDHWEMERNNARDVATPIEVNSYTIGNMYTVGGEEEDYYTFTLDEDSTVYFDFTCLHSDGEYDYWRLSCAGERGYYSHDFHANYQETERVVEHSDGIQLPAGTYWICIFLNASPWDYHCDYMFSVRTNENENYLVTTTTPAVTTTTTPSSLIGTDIKSTTTTTTTTPSSLIGTDIKSTTTTTTTTPSSLIGTDIKSTTTTTTTTPSSLIGTDGKSTTTTTSTTSGKGKTTTTTTITTTTMSHTTTKPHSTTTTMSHTTTTLPKTTTTTTTTTVTTGEELKVTLYGDVDCSGVVDVADAVLLARFLAEDTYASITQQGQKNADCDQDGNCDPDDIVMILKAIARLITLPPVT